MDPTWINAGATLIAGLAAVVSVLYAIQTYNRHEREALINSVKVDAINIKSDFKELDQTISMPFFLEVAERFEGRLDRISGANGDIEKLKSFLTAESSVPALHRMITLSVSESSNVAHSRDLLASLRRNLVGMSQEFPASAGLLRASTDFTSSTIYRLTSSSTFDDLIKPEIISDVIEKVGGSTDNYAAFINRFGGLVSDPPVNYLHDRGQKILDGCETIIDLICDVLTKRNYGQLKIHANHEKDNIESFQPSDTYTGEMLSYINIIKPMLNANERDEIVQAHAKLEALFDG